jgi:hypothetical protein
VQIELFKAIADDQSGRLGADSFAPIVFFADGDAEGGIVVLRADAV